MESEQSHSAGILELLEWAEIHKRGLIIGTAVVLLIGFGVYVHFLRRAERESAAAQALIEKRGPAGATDVAVRVKASDYLEVASKYPGTSAAEQAALLAARALFAEGRYPEAQAQFERFVAEHKGSDWVAQAEFGIAACLEAQNQADKALARYQQVATRFAADAIVPYARLACARIEEAQGRPELALRIYDELARSRTATMLGPEVRMRREELLQKYPQLATVTNMAAGITTNRSSGGVVSTNASAATASREP
jgi:predicted negative regulator of RcsB-dependent stress response